MISHFAAFKDSDLKCGIFVGRNLTHEQENKLLYNSKVAINIHDAYQRKLRSDTNERTFKALGLTGVLVSDDEGQLERIFPDVERTNDPKKMVTLVKEYVSMSTEKLNSIKKRNRKNILENHTYINRVQQLLKL
jgi:spore maturation protein CgeB